MYVTNVRNLKCNLSEALRHAELEPKKGSRMNTLLLFSLVMTGCRTAWQPIVSDLSAGTEATVRDIRKVRRN